MAVIKAVNKTDPKGFHNVQTATIHNKLNQGLEIQCDPAILTNNFATISPPTEMPCKYICSSVTILSFCCSVKIMYVCASWIRLGQRSETFFSVKGNFR